MFLRSIVVVFPSVWDGVLVREGKLNIDVIVFRKLVLPAISLLRVLFAEAAYTRRRWASLRLPSSSLCSYFPLQQHSPNRNVRISRRVRVEVVEDDAVHCDRVRKVYEIARVIVFPFGRFETLANPRNRERSTIIWNLDASLVAVPVRRLFGELGFVSFVGDLVESSRHLGEVKGYAAFFTTQGFRHIVVLGHLCVPERPKLPARWPIESVFRFRSGVHVLFEVVPAVTVPSVSRPDHR